MSQQPRSRSRILKGLAAGLAGVLFSVSALAGTVVIRSEGSDTLQKAYFQGNKLRMDTGSGEDAPASYLLALDGEVYVVTDMDGEPFVVRATSIIESLGSWASTQGGELLEVKDKGRSETIAGIKGDVYQIRFKDFDGKVQDEEVVFTDASIVRKWNQTLQTAMNLDKASHGSWYSALEEELGDNIGMLRFGNEWRLESIDDKPVADSLFVLPAEPSGLGDMFGKMMGGAAANGDAEGGETGSSNDIMGGIMGMFGGSKGDTEEAKDGEKKDGEAKSDNPLNKAFDSLFGGDDN